MSGFMGIYGDLWGFMGTMAGFIVLYVYVPFSSRISYVKLGQYSSNANRKVVEK